jgi:AcrR family transcriptional regulator
MKRDSYHHGDLHEALLTAGEAVLSELGLDGFSLRKVAARVGVSHSAPAHHFGDAQGLLVALATRGFQRLLASMQDRQRRADPDLTEQLIASGLGYLDFAQSSPALFRLVFGSGLSDRATPQLQLAGEAALLHLATDLGRLRGAEPFASPDAMAEVIATWSMTHGFAELLISGHLKSVQGQGPQARDGMFRQVLAQGLRVAERPRVWDKGAGGPI